MQASGVPILDEALGGLVSGLPLVVVGPSGSGRTVLAIQIAHAALERDKRVVLVTSEPPRVLLRQARTLELPLLAGIRSGLLSLLELDSRVATQIRVHGHDAFLDALREEADVPELLLVDPLTALTEEILEEAALRSFLRELFQIPGDGGICYAAADTARLEQDGALSRTLADLAGELLRLTREPDGSRTLTVEKSRAETLLVGAMSFRIGPGGLGAASEPTPAKVEVPAPARVAPIPEAEAKPPEARPHILVVEDSVLQQQYLTEVLGDAYDYTYAKDGFEAIAEVMSASPDLILLDLVLPRVGGHEVLLSLQSARSTVPVLVISAGVRRSSERLRVLLLGAMDVLPKPFNTIELRRKVEMLLLLPRVAPRDLADVDPKAVITDGRKRILDETDFVDRLDRVAEFCDRHHVVSTILAVQAADDESFEAFVVAADSTLRRDDLVGLVGSLGVLLLLPLTGVEQANHVIERLDEVVARGSIEASTLRFKVSPARSSADQDIKDYFAELEPWISADGE